MAILELVRNTPDWSGALHAALTRPPGVPERRAGEDPWEAPPVDRPRRISDDLAWLRRAFDAPKEAGLHPLDEALHSTWDATGEPQNVERLQRLDHRGVLQAAGFALHERDLDTAVLH
jgi:hypothetical protein